MRASNLICSCFGIVMAINTVQAATVSLTPSTSDIHISDSFSVLVSGSDFPSTAGATLGLSFDPNIAQISKLSLAAGSPFDAIDSDTFDNASGAVEFISVLAPLEGELPRGAFNAFTIEFLAVGVGAANIKLIEDGIIKGWASEGLSLISDVNYNQADITVAPVPVPVPAAAGLLFIGLGTLMVLQWRGKRLQHA